MLLPSRLQLGNAALRAFKNELLSQVPLGMPAYCLAALHCAQPNLPWTHPTLYLPTEHRWMPAMRAGKGK